MVIIFKFRLVVFSFQLGTFCNWFWFLNIYLEIVTGDTDNSWCIIRCSHFRCCWYRCVEINIPFLFNWMKSCFICVQALVIIKANYEDTSYLTLIMTTDLRTGRKRSLKQVVTEDNRLRSILQLPAASWNIYCLQNCNFMVTSLIKSKTHWWSRLRSLHSLFSDVYLNHQMQNY